MSVPMDFFSSGGSAFNQSRTGSEPDASWRKNLTASLGMSLAASTMVDCTILGASLNAKFPAELLSFLTRIRIVPHSIHSALRTPNSSLDLFRAGVTRRLPGLSQQFVHFMFKANLCTHLSLINFPD